MTEPNDDADLQDDLWNEGSADAAPELPGARDTQPMAPLPGDAAGIDAPSMRCAVIGTGALGRHHVRILSELDEAALIGIYDLRPEIAEDLAAAHGTESYGSIDGLLDAVDAVVLAVPTYAHANLAIKALEAGCHVLVEKPIASSVEDADRMVAAAERAEKLLSVGHVEFYNPAVQALLAEPNAPRFLEIQRLAPFTPRSLDVDVILDLMIHDLQILHALDPSPVEEVRATGIEVLSSRVDIVNARIALASGLVANITASRVSAESVRKLRAFLPHRYFSIDYREQSIKGYGLELIDGQRLIRPEDRNITPVEPLRAELRAFLAACRGEDVPIVDGVQGRRALATALTVGADAASRTPSIAVALEETETAPMAEPLTDEIPRPELPASVDDGDGTPTDNADAAYDDSENAS
ncbi:MAG: Gfo/Idh/MocA family oxidoreductase [Acidobacteriota bacterium]